LCPDLELRRMHEVRKDLLEPVKRYVIINLLVSIACNPDYA